MAAKSIIDVEIDDGKFKAFAALYDKYSKTLDKAPAAWANANKEVQAQRKGFEAIAAALLAQNEITRREIADTKKAGQAAEGVGRVWLGMARNTREVAGNIARATTSLLKWTALTGVFSGLLGAGGLFGIDRLAANVGAGRRSALGLGLGFGEQKAFDVNYGRLVDTGSFIANVNEALHDVTKRHSLYGAGLGEGALQGRSTGQVGAALLPLLKRLADQTPDAQLAQVLNARGLNQFIGLQDFQRLKATSASEIAGIAGAYGRDTKSLGLSDQTQRLWQDFAVQMGRAGQQIENTFVKGLVPLAKPLEQLSASFEKTVQAFLAGDTLKKWIKEAGDGIEKFAKYIATDEFQNNVRAFVVGVGRLASAIAGLGRVVGIGGDGPAVSQSEFNKSAGGDDPQSEGQRKFNGWMSYALGYKIDRHNPGNLRRPGQTSGFASFASDEEGLRAMARQLRLYQNRDHLDTIEGIVSKYAPKEENDVKAYVGDVTKRTGYGANQHLDLNDSATLATLIAAMTKHENSRNNYSPKAVVEIINNTGGNAIPIVNQVAQ